MKSRSSFALAAGVAALLTVPALHAAGDGAYGASSATPDMPGQPGGPAMRERSGEADARAPEAARSSSGSAEDEGGLSGSTGSRGAVDPAWTQSNEPPQPATERGSAMSGATGASGAAESTTGSPSPATDWPYGSTQPGSPANVHDESSTQR